MTPRAQGKTWAFKRVKQLMPVDTMAATLNDAAWLLKAEHARAVRVVQKHLRECLSAVSGETRRDIKAMWDARIAALDWVLTALQRGRGEEG